ncbi:MAG: DALR domain-containing protein [Bdellovibrionota bacterium]
MDPFRPTHHQQAENVKSLGNHISIDEFLKKWPAEVLKLCYFERHYSSNIDFSDKVFQQGRRRLLFFYETLHQLEEVAIENSQIKLVDAYKPEEFIAKFHRAMSDDFNTAQALAELNGLFKFANQVLKKKNEVARNATAFTLSKQIHQIGNVLGLFQREPMQFILELKQQVLPELGITESEIDKAITARTQARNEKNWQESDAIRDELLSKGIELRDSSQGTQWGIAKQLGDH